MKALVLAFLITVSLAAATAGAQSQVSSPTVRYANQTIANAAYYLSQVNESGYLIFYPNLTHAYANLLKAENTYNTSPSAATVLANEAVNEAHAEYDRISAYRADSMVVMGAFTIAFVLVLARIAGPVKGRFRLRSK